MSRWHCRSEMRRKNHQWKLRKLEEPQPFTLSVRIGLPVAALHQVLRVVASVPPLGVHSSAQAE